MLCMNWEEELALLLRGRCGLRRGVDKNTKRRKQEKRVGGKGFRQLAGHSVLGCGESLGLQCVHKIQIYTWSHWNSFLHGLDGKGQYFNIKAWNVVDISYYIDIKIYIYITILHLHCPLHNWLQRYIIIIHFWPFNSHFHALTEIRQQRQKTNPQSYCPEESQIFLFLFKA